MKNLLRILIVATGLSALPGIAQAADLFMLITGVPGDSTTKGHEKWIRVGSLDWKATAQSSFTASAGAQVGKPFPDAMQLVLQTGTWSQHFMRLMTQGKALSGVVIDAVSSDGRPLYRMTLEGVFVTQYRLTVQPETPLPQDDIKAIFRKVKIEYYSVGADGRVTTTFVEWDVALGTSSPTI